LLTAALVNTLAFQPTSSCVVEAEMEEITMFLRRSVNGYIGGLVIAVISCATGCGTQGQPSQTNPSTSNDKSSFVTEKAVETGKQPPDFSLSPDEIAEAAKQPDAAGKFHGKNIEVKGEIAFFGWQGSDQPYIRLKEKSKKHSLTCMTKDARPWAGLTIGQQVTLHGKWPQFGVGLMECVIAEKGKEVPHDLRAEELVKEYATDKEMTQKKYVDIGFFIIDGEVLKKETVPNNVAILKGDGKVVVQCTFSGLTAQVKECMDSVKVGERVRVQAGWDFQLLKDEFVPVSSQIVLGKAK
jgi:hypothetical protein